MDADFPLSPIPAANVNRVPQRSPFRYPGGKTWLIPHIRYWLYALTVSSGDRRSKPTCLAEPFCGGATASLCAVTEGWTDRAWLVDSDPDIAAFWRTALDRKLAPLLIRRILETPTNPSALADLAQDWQSRDAAALGDYNRAFRTLLLNRLRYGGILAKGAALPRLPKQGDDGKDGKKCKGLGSRWYPETLAYRLRRIYLLRDRLEFTESDGLEFLAWHIPRERRMALFIDPPYSLGSGVRRDAGPETAGRRLYPRSNLDHERLFRLVSRHQQHAKHFLLTYPDVPEARALVRLHGFKAVRIEMLARTHRKRVELAITNRAVFDRRK